MPIYREERDIGLIKWPDLEKFIEENGGTQWFFANMNDADGTSLITLADYEYAYELLKERFYYSVFRYTDIVAALMAFRRVSRLAVPTFVQKQKLYRDAYNISLDTLRKEHQNIRNIVEKPTVLTDNMDTAPIKNLSNIQETVTSITGTIDAITEKWRLANRDMIEEFYKEYYKLFTVFITDSDDITVYPQGGN